METKADIYYKAIELGLEIRTDVPIDKVVKIYNGTGPESFPAWAREKIDGFSETLQPAVCGHDLDYYFGKGTKADFRKANERLESNGRKCADARYGWWRPARYIVRGQAKLYAKLCQEFGWKMYLAAIRERIEDKELEDEAKERNEK